MATIRLVPSTSDVSNTQYVAVANASNMYTNTDSTTHGTFTHNRASTSNTYYGYLRGFNFDDVPSSAVVSGFTIKIKASATGHTTSTSSSYYMSLINGTTQIGSTNASGRLSTTVTTFTFAEGSLTWDTIKSYGANFGIRIPMRRANSNTADVVSVYGAEIEVTYTVSNPRTIATSLSGSGTISPSGSNTYYDGDEFELTITPTNTSDTVTATHNGSDVTSQLVAHGASSTASTDLGSYTLVSGSFSGGASTYFQGIVGHGASAAQSTTNYYSGGSSIIAVFTYDMGITVPSGATITRVWCEVNGHAESTTQSSEYMCVQLISGSTNLSEELNFKDISTSNSTQTLEATTLPTVAQLAAMKLQCRLGYYGGIINGATAHVEYETSGNITHYTYTFEVSGNATIAVTIGGSSGPSLYIKVNGSWVSVTKAYVKTNGSWSQVALDTVFSQSGKYVKGN